MWIHISKSYLFHTNKVETVHKLFFAKKQPTIIVENTENLPNSSSYTIDHKLVRNSHPLSQKLAFSQVPQQLFYTQSTNCSHTNFSKQQLTAHTSIVKKIMASVTNTHKSLQSTLL